MDIKNWLRSVPQNYNLALTVLRVVLGLTFLLHGWQKLFMMGMDNFGGFLGSLGVPAAGFLAIVVTMLELLGGLALILGIGTRIVSALLSVTMLIASVLVHLPNGFFAQNGGYELTFLLMAGTIVLVISGGGTWSLDEQIAPVDIELSV